MVLASISVVSTVVVPAIVDVCFVVVCVVVVGVVVVCTSVMVVGTTAGKIHNRHCLLAISERI